MPVRQSRHKDLNEYIAGAIKDMMEWMSKGSRWSGLAHIDSMMVGIVERVVLSIEEAASGRQLERCEFLESGQFHNMILMTDLCSNLSLILRQTVQPMLDHLPHKPANR